MIRRLLITVLICLSQAWGQTAFYRSVQPGNTSAIWAGNNSIGMLVSTDECPDGIGCVAFASPAPDSVGVGCVIQYDADNNGVVDNLAFIHARVSATIFSVRDSLGGNTYLNCIEAGGLTCIAGLDSNWSIFHAYTTQGNAISQTENTGIATALRDFDTSVDLASTNRTYHIAHYRGSDVNTSPVTTSWITT